MLATIAGISPYSYLYFRWDNNGDCTYISHSTKSGHLPLVDEDLDDDDDSDDSEIDDDDSE